MRAFRLAILASTACLCASMAASASPAATSQAASSRASAATQFAASAPASQASELILKLDDAYWQRNTYRRGDDYCALVLGATCRDGNWVNEAWAQGTLLGRYFRPGEVAEVRDTGNDLHLVVSFEVGSDRAREGDVARYVIDLHRDGHRFQGAYAGTLRGKELRGLASGTLKGAPVVLAGHVPVQPGEHPRLLFRQADIPDLRKKAQTPEGRAILEQLKQALQNPSPQVPRGYYAAGHGLLYVLTGNRRHAETAAQIAQNVQEIDSDAFRDSDSTDEDVSSALGLAMAYDFCYDAWDQAFRCRVADQLERATFHLYRFSGSESRGFTWSAWQGYTRGVLGVIALAILDDVGTHGPRSQPPAKRELDAPQGFQLGSGVPVVKFASDKVPTQWLVAGPFRQPADEESGPSAEKRDVDYLSSLGGPDKARPVEGTQARYKDATFEFRPVDLSLLALRRGRAVENTIFVAAVANDTFNSVTYYYTVVENDRPRFVRVLHEATRASMLMWIAGRQIGRGDYLKLGAGRFPVMIRAVLGDRGPQWDYSVIRPRFIELATEEQWNREYDEALTNWRNTHSDREGVGRKLESTPARLREVEYAIRRFLALGIGEHGGGEEGDGPLAHAFADGLCPFLQSYRNVMGIDLAPGSGADWVLPLCTIRTISRNGETAQPTYGLGDTAVRPLTPRRERQAEGRPAGAHALLRPQVFPMGLSIVPRECLPAVLWTFNRAWGTDGDKSFAVTSPLDGIFAFVNYPVGVAPKNPSEVLPRCVQDWQKGYCVFRNGWKDDDDFVATVWLNSQNFNRTAQETGAFRIWGLGERWAVQRRPAFRANANVVQGPTDEGVFDARTTFFEGAPDGGGCVTMETKDTYIGYRQYRKQPIGPPLVGSRSFAADYSGASGAPGLFVVVDRRPGAGKGAWTMSTSLDCAVTISVPPPNPPGTQPAAPSTGPTPLPSFTITGKRGPLPATMTGTFISPAAVQVSCSAADGAIQAAAEGDFIVVLTVQRGRAPTVQVEGAGLKANVRVGAQTITFDGTKIILGK